MHRKSVRFGSVVAALACCAAGAALVAPAAMAAQSDMSVTCDGQQFIVRTNDNNSSDMGGWGAAQVVSGGSGHLIATVFNGSLYDATVDQTIFQFSQYKGGGNGNHNQQTVNCVVSTDGTLGDFLEPGDTPPPGTSPSDSVVFTIDVTGVAKT